MSTERDPAFEDLLEFLRETRGFEHTEYKRPSLMRRFRTRMDAVGVAGFEDYRSYLEAEPREVAELLDTILINVTGFFRDPETWELVGSTVIPRLLEDADPERPIRAWSAGCASGEEPFTIAMLFAEALGEDAFHERVKIYATDVDDDALTAARQATYPPQKLADVPDPLRDKYFQQQNGNLICRNELRRAVIFGRNDLLQDPPISRVDLLASRNTLMYFSLVARERILSNFFLALNGNGYLLLGKAEAPISRSTLFIPYDLKRRVFVKSADAEPDRPRLRGPVVLEQAPPEDRPLQEAAFEQAVTAELVVDTAGRVAVINQPARALFGLRASDVGRPLQELELSYRPLELRSLIDETYAEGRPVSRKEIEWTSDDGQRRFLDVQITPLHAATGQLLGTSISFGDISRHRMLHEELEGARIELEKV
jgi:two-component system CheB/CheR fusion protein